MSFTPIDIALLLVGVFCLWRANDRRLRPDISRLYAAIGFIALLLFILLLFLLPDPIGGQMMLW